MQEQIDPYNVDENITKLLDETDKSVNYVYTE